MGEHGQPAELDGQDFTGFAVAFDVGVDVGLDGCLDAVLDRVDQRLHAASGDARPVVGEHHVHKPDVVAAVHEHGVELAGNPPHRPVFNDRSLGELREQRIRKRAAFRHGAGVVGAGGDPKRDFVDGIDVEGGVDGGNGIGFRSGHDKTP